MEAKVIRNIIAEGLMKLRTQRILAKPAPPHEVAELPPFHAVQAGLAARIRAWKILFFASITVLGGVIIFQQRIIFHKLFQKMNEQIVIVPGSPEFFRVRPGQIPDESVFLFSEYIAANIGTYTHRNVKYQYGKIAEHMNPATKGKFEAALEARIKDWEERSVDQVFAYEPVKKYDQIKDEFGSKYITAVTGQRTQYVEGHVFSETKDVLLIEFRARGNLTPERPFIFEIVKMDWLTVSQYQALVLAQKSNLSKENP